jgi:O-antigen/teichoic acid export membrane protein
VPIASLLTTAAFPLLVRSAFDDRFARRMQRLFEIGLTLGAGIALMLVVGAEPLVAFVGGKEFDPAIPVLRIQGASVAASFLFAVWAAGLLAIKAQRSLLIATIAGIGSVVTLTAALAPTEGAVGTAVAMTVSEALLAGVTGFLLMRRRELRVRVAVVPKVLAAVAAGLAVLLLGLPQVVLAALALAAYVVALGALRGLPSELRHLSLQRWSEFFRGD